MEKNDKSDYLHTENSEETKKLCGIIMPISGIDGCDAAHWDEVKQILSESIKNAGYTPHLVSDASDSGVIQKRIVQNIYDNEIVVCDVSCKNPNVMFELGMRLAFDKPTIIVIDDKTNYSFDTAPIEHLSYPRDLRYSKILDFKAKLAEKIEGTIKASKKPEYTTFLKNFGEFNVAEIEKKEGPMNEVIISRLEDLTSIVVNTNRRLDNIYRSKDFIDDKDFKTRNHSLELRKIISSQLSTYSKTHNITTEQLVQTWDMKPEEILEHITQSSQLSKYGIDIADIISMIEHIISSYRKKIF